MCPGACFVSCSTGGCLMGEYKKTALVQYILASNTCYSRSSYELGNKYGLGMGPPSHKLTRGLGGPSVYATHKTLYGGEMICFLAHQVFHEISIRATPEICGRPLSFGYSPQLHSQSRTTLRAELHSREQNYTLSSCNYTLIEQNYTKIQI